MKQHHRHLFFNCVSISMVISLAACDASKGVSTDGGGSQNPDPVVVDHPIAYVERPIPRDEDGEIVPDNAIDPAAFKPGARLLLKERASVPAEEIDLTEGVFINPDAAPDDPAPLYDVKDLSVSYDGLRLLFSMRAPEDENADEDEQPTWNIWEYNRETHELKRVITSDLSAELGQDVDPHYLADGRIVFASTRQPRAKAVLLDEGKPQYAPGTEEDRDEATFVLHVMDDDGTNIEQISYNQSHDLAPTVLDTGEIVYLRWDNYVRGNHDRLSLYKTDSKGRKHSLLYGYHSQSTGTNLSPAAFLNPIQMPDGRLLVSLRERESEVQGGDLVLIDTADFVENTQGINGNSSTGPAQLSISNGRAYTNGQVSPSGYYSSAYPLYDGTNRIMASWSACLLQGIRLGIYVNNDGVLINNAGEFVDTNGNVLVAGTDPVTPNAEDVGSFPCSGNIAALDQIAAPTPIYGIWTFDFDAGTQRPVVLAQADTMYTEAVVLKDHPLPAFDEQETIDDEQQALIDSNLGIVHIRSVYDFHGIDNTTIGIAAIADPALTPPDQRPARFLRLVKAVSLPNQDVYDFDNSAFGRAGRQMKDILGYVPIEPDGSAKFQVPADVAFTFSIIDSQGRRISGNLGNRHQNWLTVRPGETRECGGCHARDNTLPHGRLDAESSSSWLGATGGVPFPNTLLLDSFGTPQPPPNAGETMGEYYARVNGARKPSVDIVYDDDWSDDNIVTKAASFDHSYADLMSAAPPTSAACQIEWTSLCRVVINYIEHIQPVWDANRQVFDPADPTLLIDDRTCTTCHSAVDAMGAAQEPAGELELTSNQSADRNDFFTSFAELMFPDVPQELVGGMLVNQQVQATDDDGNPLFVVNADGTLALDADGNPIPVLVDAPTRPAYLSPAGARNSRNFFNLFGPGASHDGYLNSAELKLIAEWLDIGGQYYNNPFAAPED